MIKSWQIIHVLNYDVQTLIFQALRQHLFEILYCEKHFRRINFLLIILIRLLSLFLS